MDPTAVLEAVQNWPLEDQLHLVFDVWDRLVEAGWQPELTDDLKAELDRRLAAHQQAPNNVRSWQDVLARVRRPQ